MSALSVSFGPVGDKRDADEIQIPSNPDSKKYKPISQEKPSLTFDDDLKGVCEKLGIVAKNYKKYKEYFQKNICTSSIADTFMTANKISYTGRADHSDEFVVTFLIATIQMLNQNGRLKMFKDLMEKDHSGDTGKNKVIQIILNCDALEALKSSFITLYNAVFTEDVKTVVRPILKSLLGDTQDRCLWKIFTGPGALENIPITMTTDIFAGKWRDSASRVWFMMKEDKLEFVDGAYFLVHCLKKSYTMQKYITVCIEESSTTNLHYILAIGFAMVNEFTPVKYADAAALLFGQVQSDPNGKILIEKRLPDWKVNFPSDSSSIIHFSVHKPMVGVVFNNVQLGNPKKTEQQIKLDALKTCISYAIRTLGSEDENSSLLSLVKDIDVTDPKRNKSEISYFLMKNENANLQTTSFKVKSEFAKLFPRKDLNIKDIIEAFSEFVN